MPQTIDYLILIVPTVIVLIVAWRTRRHMQGVSDFMSGGRVAGRYLVAVSDSMAIVGLITVLALFEQVYASGFALRFWTTISIPVVMLVTMTGFVVYRFRETRAFTLAQFFEARYSRRFRIFAGVLGAASGIINYGLFPAVGAQFFVSYCDLPAYFSLAGVHVLTLAALMFAFLTAAVAIILTGGQLTILVTDFLQGMFTYIACIVLAVVVLYMFRWDQITSALSQGSQGHSLLDPFDSFALKDFNIVFVLIGAFASVYGVMAWQGTQGFNCAAASAHEAKMGKMLGTWRMVAITLMLTVLAVAAYTFLNHPDFAAASVPVHERLAAIANPAIRTQQSVPLALAHFLPAGASGAFMAVMAFLMISTDTAYLHSWGTIIIQDIVLPMRQRPFTPRQQLLLLRLSVTGVAVFAFCFSLFFTQATYILMFMAMTGAIYLGGAGACIIGGLYWRRGTAAGAWGAMIVGSSIAALGIVLTHGWGHIGPWLLASFPNNRFLIENQARFPINGQVMFFIAMMGGIVTYVVLSLLTCRKPFDLDRMLNRAERTGPSVRPSVMNGLRRLLGIGPEFTVSDKVIAMAVFGWSMFLFIVWLVVTLWNLVTPWPLESWGTYCLWMGVIVPLIVGVITTAAFGIGGTRDLIVMFRRLREMTRDERDDGRVVADRAKDGARGDVKAVPTVRADVVAAK